MLSIPPALEQARAGLPVAVFGHGVTGRALIRLIQRLGWAATVYDERGGEGLRNAFTSTEAEGHGLVLFSPGFRIDHPWLETARQAGALCLTEIDFAAALYRGRIVAVTGTNGKSTLCAFLAEVIRQAGFAARAVGNIGDAFADCLASDPIPGTVVCEVSSFQAEALRLMCPESVIWTNFADDHLDRHGSRTAYFAAKRNLLQRAGRNPVIVGRSVATAARQEGFALPPQTVVVDVPDTLAPLPDHPLMRPPQDENLSMARIWADLAGIDQVAFATALGPFQSLPHRLVPVGRVGDVTFWDDAKATNLHAIEGALRAFTTPPVWIGGGRAKGGRPDGFGALAGRIAAAVVIGETAPTLHGLLETAGVPVESAGDLAQAVPLALTLAQTRHCDVLFSPGFASFDQFRNYAERGECFVALARALPDFVSSPNHHQSVPL